MSKFLHTYSLEWMETKLKWKLGLVRSLLTSETVLTKSGRVILTKTNFEMNLLSLMAMAKMMKITNLEKNMLNLRRLPRILNQARLLKARKAPSLRSKTSCNLNLKRWPCSILLKKFAKLWATSFLKRMKILPRKRRKSFEMSCSSIKFCPNLISSSSQTLETSEKTWDFTNHSLLLM